MKKSIKLVLFILCVQMMLISCIHPDREEVTTQRDQQILEEVSTNYYESVEYEYQSEVDVDKLLTGRASAYLLLVNKDYPLGEEFAPESIVTLNCDTYLGKAVELETKAAEALYEMMDEMHTVGVTDIMVTSGYRTYLYQSGLFQQYLSNEMTTISEDARRCFSPDYIMENYTKKGLTALTYEDARTVVLSYSAYPGTSEHQTGLCVDFITSEMSGLTTAFENTEAFSWLVENAYKFGFVLRYPKGKEDITGYTYEPWHYRFVGREAATDMHFGNLTLEEYLDVMEKQGD